MNHLLENYLPAPADVPAEQVLAARNLLTVLWGLYLPDVDTRPNSVIGDSFFAGAAPVMAAADIAVERLLSDLDPEQVANNIIYDCSVVEKFLANFGVYAPASIGTAGYVRLVFNVIPPTGSWELPRHLRFRFSDSTVEYSIRLPQVGPLILRAPGYPLAGGTNSVALVQTGPASFSAFVAVESTAVETILDGASATVSVDLPGLQSAVGYSFSTYPVAVGLPELARKTRLTAYAASPSTVGGLRRFAEAELPGVLAISPTGPGDPEQLRAGFTTLGFPKPAVDIHVRGRRGFRLETQLVQLFYDAASQRFCGEFAPLVTPQLMQDVVWEGNTAVTLAHTVWMRPPAELPGVLAAGSGEESYWISLAMPLDDDDAELVSITPDAAGSYAWFSVSYLADAEVGNVRNTFSGGDWRLFGADVIVLPFRVVEITSMVVKYRREAGTRILLDTARAEIAANINTTNFPKPLSQAAWVDSMLYAGAEVVTDIEVAATVRWTIADRIIPTAEDPVEDFDAADAAAKDAPTLDLDGPQNLTPAYVDPDLGTVDATYAAAGARNVTWYIRPESIYFEELK